MMMQDVELARVEKIAGDEGERSGVADLLVRTEAPLTNDPWPAVDGFVDACLAAASPEVLIAHGIGLLAGDRLQRTCQVMPPILQGERAVATMLHLGSRSLLQRIRSLLDGPMILLKGPEVAAHYPRPALRPFSDLDILVPDSQAAKTTLLSAGFRDVDDYEFAHTQRPVQWPGLPLYVELHHQLPWLHWMSPPRAGTYFARAIPSATGLPDVATLPPADHALLVAAHAWHHAPLRRLGDLMDITAMTAGLDPSEVEGLAAEYGLLNVWRTSIGARDALLSSERGKTWPMRLWARHLFPPRDRSVFEVHLARWVGALWAPTLTTKLASIRTTALEDLGPLPGEPWGDKFARTKAAVTDAGDAALLRNRNS